MLNHLLHSTYHRRLFLHSTCPRWRWGGSRRGRGGLDCGWFTGRRDHLVPLGERDPSLASVSTQTHKLSITALCCKGAAITSWRGTFPFGARHVLNYGRVHVLTRLGRSLRSGCGRACRGNGSDRHCRSRTSWRYAGAHNAVLRLMSLVLSIQSAAIRNVSSRAAASDVPTLLGCYVGVCDRTPPLPKPRNGPRRDGCGSRVPTRPTAVHLNTHLKGGSAKTDDGSSQYASGP